MNAQPVAVPAEVNRPIRTSPAGNAREPKTAARGGQSGPGLQHDWLWRNDPPDSAIGNRAVLGTDPLPDGRMDIVAGEDVGEPERVPHLSEAGIGVEEHPQPRSLE